MTQGDSRTVRIFLSSTFRDFGEERDLLVRQVFPALRARLKERFVELVDVDLRWGITVEQAERGEVLPICLTEIDRSRPYFIGMLGERYGWVPPAGALSPDLLERQPWLAEHAGGASVTELEILHGVLNNPALAGRAFFYLRSPHYARRKAGPYLPENREDRARQVRLKRRIRRSGFPVVRYDHPEALAARIAQDLWQLLDAQYPAGEVPSPAERALRQHEAYAAPRRRLYLGGEDLLAWLDQAVAAGASRILVEGASGGGKSALLANWAERHTRAHPQDPLLAHYLAASADAAAPRALVRRLIGFIQRSTGSTDEIPDATEALFESFAGWLALAGDWAQERGVRWVFVLDAFNSLRSRRDLLWFPTDLPARVHVVISCLPGKVRSALSKKGAWQALQVPPMDGSQRRELLVRYLATFNKTLPADLAEQVLDHALAGNPLFLRTLAEELRVFGEHDVLRQRVAGYLASGSIDDLFERVLARLEEDFGAASVSSVMRAIWASRAGLLEEEMLTGARAGITPLVHANWAPLRHALDDLLVDAMGRIGFAHDYLRDAVRDRYLQAPGEAAATHRALAGWFAQEPPQARRSFEQPYQLREAQDWPGLRACLTDREMFRAVHRHRGEQELLSYWLVMARAGEESLERAYAAAWPQWQVGEGADVLDAGMRLQRFLRFAGHSGPFALEVARQTLDRVRAQHGPDHPDAINVLQHFALLLRTRGELDQALGVYQQVLVDASRVHGPLSPQVGRVLLSLAGVHRAQGRPAQAEDHARRALAIQEAAQGSQDMAIWSALNTLSMILTDQRRYKEALPLQTRALKIVQSRRGFRHRDTATSLVNVSSLFMDLGKKEEAERGLRRALSLREALLGPDHDLTATVRNNLGLLLKSMQRWDEARTLYTQALERLERQLGRRHARVALSLGNLGSLLIETGEWEQAQALLEECLDIRISVLGPRHPDVASAQGHLARLHQKKGELEKALLLREQELALREQVLGGGHADTRGSLESLTSLVEAMGDLARAESLYLRLLALREQALGAGSKAVVRTRERLAALYERQGRMKDAARYRAGPGEGAEIQRP